MNKSLLKNYLNCFLQMAVFEPLFLLFFIWHELWNDNVFVVFNIILCITIFLYALIILPKLFTRKRDFLMVGIIWFVITNIFPIGFYASLNKSFGDFINTYTLSHNIYGAVHYCSFLFPTITPLFIKLFPKLKNI